MRFSKSVALPTAAAEHDELVGNVGADNGSSCKQPRALIFLHQFGDRLFPAAAERSPGQVQLRVHLPFASNELTDRDRDKRHMPGMKAGHRGGNGHG
eukprot:1160365-Pelagomonas_calceolata.AAC.4